MKTARHRSAAYTLVELLIGITLALAVMTGVLSTYLFLGRQLSRLTYQQVLETEARRTMLQFAKDSRIATSVSSPDNSSVILNIPTASSTATITYTYTSGGNNTGTLTRTPSAGTAQVLLRYISAFDFNYYDSSDTAVTDFTNKVSSIKKVSFTFSTQTGTSNQGTLTPVYEGASPRHNLANSALLN